MSMSIEESKALVNQYAEAFNTANLTIFEEVFDPEVTDHNPLSNKRTLLEVHRSTISLYRATSSYDYPTIRVLDTFSKLAESPTRIARPFMMERASFYDPTQTGAAEVRSFFTPPRSLFSDPPR